MILNIVLVVAVVVVVIAIVISGRVNTVNQRSAGDVVAAREVATSEYDDGDGTRRRQFKGVRRAALAASTDRDHTEGVTDAADMGLVSVTAATLSFYPFGVLFFRGPLVGLFFPFSVPLMAIATALACVSVCVALNIACRWIRGRAQHRRELRASLDAYRLFPAAKTAPSEGVAGVLIALIVSLGSAAAVVFAVYVHLAVTG